MIQGALDFKDSRKEMNVNCLSTHPFIMVLCSSANAFLYIGKNKTCH